MQKYSPLSWVREREDREPRQDDSQKIFRAKLFSLTGGSHWEGSKQKRPPEPPSPYPIQTSENGKTFPTRSSRFASPSCPVLSCFFCTSPTATEPERCKRKASTVSYYWVGSVKSVNRSVVFAQGQNAAAAAAPRERGKRNGQFRRLSGLAPFRYTFFPFILSGAGAMEENVADPDEDRAVAIATAKEKDVSLWISLPSGNNRRGGRWGTR